MVGMGLSAWLMIAFITLLDLLVAQLLLGDSWQLPTMSGLVTHNLEQARLWHTVDWVLLMGIILLLVQLVRARPGEFASKLRRLSGLQLVVGGLLGHAITLVIYNQIVHPLLWHVSGGYIIPLSLGDVAIVGGALLWLVQCGLPVSRFEALLRSLQPARERPINLSSFPRGIDNVHIDVLLSPAFTAAVREAIEHLLPQVLQRRSGRGRATPHYLSRRIGRAYQEMMQATAIRAKNTAQVELLGLLYVSLFKFIHYEVRTAISTLRQRHQDQQGKQTPMFARTMEPGVNTSLTGLDIAYYELCHLLFTLLAGVEQESLVKLRRTLFGKNACPLAATLSIPLLHASSFNQDYVLMQHYLLFDKREGLSNSFTRLDTLLNQLLAANDILPKEGEAGPWEEGSVEAGSMLLHSEYRVVVENDSVMMHPANVTLLLDEQWMARRIDKARRDGLKPKLRHLRRQRRQQQRLIDGLLHALKRDGLLQVIAASYAVAEIEGEKRYNHNPVVLIKVLAEGCRRWQGEAKLASQLQGIPNAPPLELLRRACERVREQTGSRLNQSQLLFRFFRDFAAYRQDLKFYFRLQQGMGEVSLLQDEKDIQTSQANRMLHAFLSPQEQGGESHDVVRHAILKADLRGSTQITDELIRRRLNPATHFSRHFFSPINHIIDRYGAEKVFIEGDAIILILNETTASGDEDLCVSRACGLASDMLRVVERQNAQLVSYGLPQLELGIGIAYSNQPPRYLFDNDRRITISQAINRADRLSACTWSVREWLAGQISPLIHVAVFEPAGQAVRQGEKAQKALVYNLNGVVLEETAFEKLGREVTLKRIKNVFAEFHGSKLYASRYPDVEGSYHGLMVRKAPITYFDPDQVFGEAAVAEGHFFYEVIYDRRVIDMFRATGRKE